MAAAGLRPRRTPVHGFGNHLLHAQPVPAEGGVVSRATSSRRELGASAIEFAIVFPLFSATACYSAFSITIVWVGTNQSRDPLGVPALAR